MDCKDAAVGGGGVISESGLATAFSYFGLPKNTSLSIGGNGQLAGAVYAPNADINLNGGGNVYGSLMGKSLNVNGNFSFHYDEALSRYFVIYAFKILSWDEI